MKKSLITRLMVDIGLVKMIRVMRLIIFILLVGITQTLAIGSYSQTTRLTLEMRDVPIEKVLEKIEDSSEFYFLYNQNKVDVGKKVDVNVRNVNVAEILQQLFKGSDIEYTIIDRQIVLTNKGSEESVSQQTKPISGKVADSSGLPLPGVTVVVKGTANGTVTNSDGEFSLSNVPGDAVLQFSFVGMKTQEIPIAGKTSINVTMAEDAIGIEEVVAVGYGTQKKINVVGSIATINTDELNRAPVASTTNALAGRLPGLITKQESGLPGGDEASLNIRGFGAPLIIVDGIESDFNNISASEIESISVLKDASAAIYGARAGKGVILITTKRGVEGKPKITFDMTYSSQRVTNILRQASSGQQAEMLLESHLQSGQPESSARFTQEEVDLFYAGTNPDYPNTDWLDVVTRRYSPEQQYNLSIRGGNEKIKYYGFFGYLNQQSMFKNNGGKYNRYNIRSNIDAKILENLSLQIDISSIIEARRFPWRGDEKDDSVWQDYWNTEPFYPSTLPDDSKVAYANGGGTGGIHISSNSELSGYRNTDKQNFKISLALNYDFNFVKGLKARAFFNYAQDYSFYKKFDYLIETWTYSYATDTYTSMGGDSSPSLTHTDTRSHSITGQFSLNYDRTFAKEHHISGLLLYELIDYYDDWIKAKRINYATTAIDYLFAGSVDDQAADGSASEMGRVSYIGRMGYDYKSKYLLETTLRCDASAKYSSDKRWGYFPSISLGWRIAEENFVRDNIPFLSNLKLRASASQTGDDSVASFLYLSGYNYGLKYVFDGTTEKGLVASSMANPDLTWEKMNIYNIGIDFGLWKNKLYGEMDVFYRERKGIAATRELSIPSTFGADLPTENLNSQNNRGFEFLLGYTDRIKDLKWDVSANISWSRAKWGHYEESEYADEDEIRLYKNSGRWTDRTYGYKSDGLFTSQKEIDALTYEYTTVGNDDLKPGDVRYVNTNGDDVLDWRDKEDIGKGTTPHWVGGMDINLSYRHFGLSAMFQGATGFYHELDLPSTSTFTYKERWTEESNNRNALVPRLGGSASNEWTSDYRYVPANYLRLKTLTFAYNLSEKWLRPRHLENVQVYFAAVNLFTISGLDKYHVDPEALSSYSAHYYPLMRTYSLGLKISL